MASNRGNGAGCSRGNFRLQGEGGDVPVRVTDQGGLTRPLQAGEHEGWVGVRRRGREGVHVEGLTYAEGNV